MIGRVGRRIAKLQSDKLAPPTIRQAVIVLRSALDAAVRDNMIGRNPCLGLKLPKLQHREAAYFEPGVVEPIAAEVAPPYDLLFRLLGIPGLRWGEAAALRRRDVDLLRRRLRVEATLVEVHGHLHFGTTKSHSIRSVPLSPMLLAELKRHLDEHVEAAPDALLFTGYKGRPAPLPVRVYGHVEAGTPSPGTATDRTPHSAPFGGRSDDLRRRVTEGSAVDLGPPIGSFTLTVYGHLFDADLDDLAAKLDFPAAWPRPGGLKAVPAEGGK